MIPCQECITLAVCKALIRSIADSHKINFMEIYDEPGNVLKPEDIIESIQLEIINRLKHKCSIIKEHIIMEPNHDKIRIIEQYPSETGYRLNEYAIQQLFDFFEIPSINKSKQSKQPQIRGVKGYIGQQIPNLQTVTMNIHKSQIVGGKITAIGKIITP